jgi:protein-disulfide isomerase
VDELTSAAPPPVGPGDHARGKGRAVILYLDLACPHCAAAWVRIRELPLRVVLRHFPVASKHPRAPALHAAAEAAASQREDAFWEMVDSIYLDRGHVDDPHLWERAERLGLDLAVFNGDRRSDPVTRRVRDDFESGIRAGVGGTPAAFIDAEPLRGDVVGALRALGSAALE